MFGLIKVVGVIIGLVASLFTIQRNCEPLGISECAAQWLGWAKRQAPPTAGSVEILTERARQQKALEDARAAAVKAQRDADEAETRRKLEQQRAAIAAEERRRTEEQQQRQAALERQRLEQQRQEAEQRRLEEVRRMQAEAEHKRRTESARQAEINRLRCATDSDDRTHCCQPGHIAENHWAFDGYINRRYVRCRRIN